MFAVIISEKDPAGLNIKKQLLRGFGFKRLNKAFEGTPIYQYNSNIQIYTTHKDSIHCENIDDEIRAELIVFATMHKSASGTPSLSLHAPGNWGLAELGGKPRELCKAPALYMKRGFQILNGLGHGAGYEITMEVTHHGPLLRDTPCFFIEIGSGVKQWNDSNAGRIIASTIIKTLSSPPLTLKPCVGLGGGHYAPSFNKLQLSSDFAIGHICPKYAISSLSIEILTQAIENTIPMAEFVLLDWKGLGPRKQEIHSWIKTLGIKVERCRKIML